VDSTRRKALGMSPARAPRRRTTQTAAVAASAALALTLTACGGSIGSSSAATDGGGGGKTLTIGFLAPVTGPVAAEGAGIKRGFDLAVKEINANGGVLGHPIKVVFADDKADPATATQAANKMITQDHVSMLFGTITGDTSLAVGKVAGATKVPFSTAEMGTGGICNDYVWPFGETDPMILKPLVPVMMQAHGKRVALVGSDYNFPHNFNKLAAQLITQAGGTVVDEEYAPLGTSDWQPVVNKLAAAKPDWVLSAVVGGDAVAFMKQADQFGLLKSTAVTGISLIQDYYPALGSIDDGRELVTRYSDELPTAANKKFVQAYRAAYNWQGPIQGVAANAYEGLHFIAKAVNAAGNTGSDAIVKALKTTTMDGIFGQDKFSANHRFETAMQLVQIQPGGKYVPVKDLGVVTDSTECK
jgi:branched-chain amino acid transport system substrate-binding protein/urea transport system substrate-binding protein